VKIVSVGGGFLVRWIELKRDDIAFTTLLDQVLAVLEQASAPPPSERCEF